MDPASLISAGFLLLAVLLYDPSNLVTFFHLGGVRSEAAVALLGLVIVALCVIGAGIRRRRPSLSCA